MKKKIILIALIGDIYHFHATGVGTLARPYDQVYFFFRCWAGKAQVCFHADITQLTVRNGLRSFW